MGVRYVRAGCGSNPRRWIHPPLRARSRRLLLIGLLSLLSACAFTSTRVAGWYVTRQIDHYVDLSAEQKGLVRPKVDQEIDRIRREELPRWLDLLRKVRDEIARGATEQGSRALQERYDQLLDAAVARLAGQFAPLLADLDAEQIAHFEKRLVAHVDDVLYPEHKLPPDERQEELDGKLIDSIEDLAGDLEDAQKKAILTAVHAAPDDREQRYKHDRARAFSFVKFLRTKPNSAQVEAELVRLWATRFDALGPGHDLNTRRTKQRRLLLSLDKLLTAQQRAHTVEHLNRQILKAKKWLLPSPA